MGSKGTGLKELLMDVNQLTGESLNLVIFMSFCQFVLLQLNGKLYIRYDAACSWGLVAALDGTLFKQRICHWRG
jgi:hypothetical protein